MKKLLTWLFADFLYNLYEGIGHIVCKHIATNFQFALFKNNIEIPQTRFTHNPATYSSPLTNTPMSQIVGNATIDISQLEITGNTGDIELRCVGVPVTLIGPDLGGQPTSSVRASLNIEKIA